MNGTKENAVKITKTVSCHYSKRIEQEKIANKTVKEKKLVSGKDQLLTATFLVTIDKLRILILIDIMITERK